MAHYFQTPVEVRINFPSTATGNARPTIVIVDRVSNTVLVDVEMSGEDFTQLLAARQVIALADVAPVEKYAHVGMKAENKTVDGWPEEWRRMVGKRIQGFGYETLPEMEEWAQAYIEEEGWDTYEWRYHNYGWGLIVRRHVEMTEEDRLSYVDRHKF